MRLQLTVQGSDMQQSSGCKGSSLQAWEVWSYVAY